mmetsp:Transcript_14675/g.25079  ORF Transcript_14675/g.25079 Transcript_14675/m.25079 type:complete len:168 (-) Transcript_14675:681-1184(-)
MIYKDIFSGDDMISDSFSLRYIDDIILEAKGKMILIDAADQTHTDGRPSAVSESGGEDSKLVIDIVHHFHLQELADITPSKFVALIRGYVRRIVAYVRQTHPQNIDKVRAGAPGFIRKVLAKLHECQFFTGESKDHEAGLVILMYGDDGITPFLYYFLDGLKSEKKV